MKSKKQIYKNHGIEYKDGKILSPIGWIPEILKEGNSKTGKKVWTLSTCPGTGTYTAEINGKEYTVKGTCVCDCTGCYAKAGFYNMPSVIKAMVTVTYLINYHIYFVEEAISAQIEIIGRTEIRLNAAGDFNTKNPDEYTSMLHRVTVKYSISIYDGWGYTKVKKYESLFDDVKNANIVKSIIPGYGYNFGHCDYIIKVYKELKKQGKRVYICLCGIDKNKHCENCSVCALYEYVLFLEHSTEYKAENDSLYPELCELALHQ